jgi:phosphoribosylformimino-5-aminoimidazole carboxamide ribotide isomerase
VVRGLLALHPFRSLYIADLDAIRKAGDHVAAVRGLTAAFPDVEFWVDGGFAGECACRRFVGSGLGRPVLGSESQPAGTTCSRRWPASRPGPLARLQGGGPARPARAVRAARPLARERHRHDPRRRGRGRRARLARLEEVLAAAGGSRRVYAAGGVRGTADLERLAALGCAGALVASALHDGRLEREDLRRFG